MVEALGRWCTTVNPKAVTLERPKKPGPPVTIVEQTAVQAKVSAFGSTQVSDLMGAWMHTVWEVDQAYGLTTERLTSFDRDIQMGRRDDPASGYEPTWDELNKERRPAEKRARSNEKATSDPAFRLLQVLARVKTTNGLSVLGPLG